ncbi:MAG TPA: NADH-ubiquinone oxidoreductase-F iron-sulfur binding region domain-containing protein [Vitreimonas sp.]|nr:NADH-ubiquinone oxidoreductase-F iron-sulfur binding region domain-containing protein [Vitreimonas sp.]
MTTILPTPAGWPSVLLHRAEQLRAHPAMGFDDPAAALDVAVAAGAFEALKRAVRDLGPAGTIATVAASGLRGRGGAGFPTGDKWRTAAMMAAPQRYVVANGYGADPGSMTDRALIEADPFLVIEGLAIAAIAIGATEAVIALRAADTEAVRRLGGVVDASVEAGFLGRDILGSGHDVNVTVRPVQGAYMLGEETVLLKAIEGRRGQPEQRPPHPAERGLFGMPTVVQNVQTLAAVPWVLINGADAHAGLGTGSAPGTMLVQVRGAQRDGVAEVPLGVPLGELVALGGKPARGRSLKAVVVGGPSGGILPPELLDTPYEFDALRAVGAHVGSGSVIAADDRACVVDLARLLTGFCSTEACGKSIPCRIGTRRLFEIAGRITTGLPKPTDPALVADLSSDIVASALCEHERLATLPLTSGMRYFGSELDAHILRSSCPAGVCRPIAVGAAAH